MTDDIAGVLDGNRRWAVRQSDAIEFLRSLPDDSIDLLLFSPPYEKARTYSLGKKLPAGQAWVDWMVEVFRVAAPKVKGLIACVCQGQTRNYRWSAVPAMLMADLHRGGFTLRNPPVFHRVGIPGSGGPDWLRGDYEWVVCATRPGRLPWSDNTACGHAPKWAPGGNPSHRTASGVRVNRRTVNSVRSHRGGVERKVEAAVVSQAEMPAGTKLHTKDDGTGKMRVQLYVPPAKANPGSVIHAVVGGGRMGHPLAHENDAPFPLSLAEFFVKSFCPPDGVTADCFTGSSTTGHAAVIHGRRFVGADLRQSQVDLSVRRLTEVTREGGDQQGVVPAGPEGGLAGAAGEHAQAGAEVRPAGGRRRRAVRGGVVGGRPVGADAGGVGGGEGGGGGGGAAGQAGGLAGPAR